MSTLWILTLGFFLGLKHATESDHVAAVSTMVGERKSLWSSSVVGAVWGLGHTISLIIAGLFVLLLNFEITPRTAQILEFAVGIMLVLLGLNVLRKIIFGGQFHFHAHRHGELTHAHPHVYSDDEADEAETHHGLKFSPRALVIGMVHGLAGSAALMLIILKTIDSRIVGLFYILVFGVGSIGGMMLMSFLVGLPFHFAGLKSARLTFLLQSIAGIISVVVGALLIYEIGITDGLLLTT